MTASLVPESIVAECKRHIDECVALLERTSDPAYRQQIVAMAKAWFRIAQRERGQIFVVS
jgi:hypothetical protein